MSGETEKDQSAWTVDSAMAHLLALREADRRHYDAIREADNLRNEQRFSAQEAASVYVRQTTNEFRGQLSDQATTFITRAEALARAQSNADKIDALATRIDRTEGRSGGLNAGWGWLVGAVGLVGALIAIFVTLSK